MKIEKIVHLHHRDAIDTNVPPRICCAFNFWEISSGKFMSWVECKFVGLAKPDKYKAADGFRGNSLWGKAQKMPLEDWRERVESYTGFDQIKRDFGL